MQTRNNELSKFGDDLASVVGRPTVLRPFVCEGSPLKCEVFIVGYNPATKMEGDWWRFWKPDYGYQKNLWLASYYAERGSLSKTRAKIEDIAQGLPDVHVLETNIDARPSAAKIEYRKPFTGPFDFLLAACQPKVIIAHGTNAVAHLQTWKPKGALIECRHFIYVGQERTADIIAATRLALQHTRSGG